MDRREAIRRTAYLMGGAVSAPTLFGILQGCSSKPSLDWKPVFFTEDQAYVISQVAEIYIPKTDTPGARETGVPAFIEEMVSTVYADDVKTRFMEGLDAFMKKVEEETGDSFADLELEQQIQQVRNAHDQALADEKGSSVHPYPRPFITLTKELTLLGFFTSESGASQVLQYEPVPGAYFGCKPLSEVGGKAWATS